MSFQNLKKFFDLKFQNLIISIVQLLDLVLYKNIELKLKSKSENWISFELSYLYWFSWK